MELTKKMTDFLSTKPTTSSQVKEESKEPKPAPKLSKKVSPEEALARIRAKFGKEGNKTTKKPPIIVEAKPVDLEHDKKVSENCYGGFESTLREWIQEGTIEFLRTRARVPEGSDNEPDDIESFLNEPRKAILRATQQFYAGDTPVEQWKKKAKHIKEAAKVRMPNVDNYDQHTRRMDILMQSLLVSWKKLMNHLNANHSIQFVKPFVASFGLTASNLTLDKFEKRICVALLFRMVCYCDEDLEENFFSPQGVHENFTSYLESIECEKSIYDRLEKVIFGLL
ncbi:hypothetical protein L596_029987 [Steinernema carpocapsae]|uniref:Uncharacterized protein n=1 Tax=Steinernema carpocapsae TaxID=34508 RepID=A0A4U5LRD4_STECR|nr:hypothetical protein L596_029987 [Steinernema carpocapsae]